MQAIIHDKSSSIPLPKLDVFGVPPTQTMVEKDLETEHRPITSLDSSPCIQFEITTALDEYLDLEKISLFMKIKIKNDTALVDKKDFEFISPVNYLLHSMIKQLDIYIGDTPISSSTPTYAYRAYFESLFGFSEEMKSSHLSSALWFNDEDDKDDVVIKDRSVFLSEYKELDLFGRLHTDLAFQGRSLIGGCKLTFRIILNDSKFFLMSATHKPVIDILEAAIFVHRSKVSPMVVEAHRAAMKIATAKYPITMIKLKTLTLSKGIREASFDNVHSGQLPRRIFIGLVSNQAFIGDYGLNPFRFKHYNLANLTVYIDGTQYPTKGFNPTFNKGLFQKEFLSLYESLDMIDCDPTFKINRKNYANGNTLYGINFAPDLSNGCGSVGHVNPLKYGSLRMTLRFNEETTEAITILIFCEFDKILEIDINRKAHIDQY